MVNMLFSLYNFDEQWARDSVGKYINSNDKVLIIPFSFGDKISNVEEWQNSYSRMGGAYYDEIVRPFISYGISEDNIHWINYFNDTSEEAQAKIRNSDIIFFTGGLPDRMMERLRQFELVDEIEHFKGVIMGSSAGALIQLAEYYISPDEDYDTFSYNRGLNIIKDFGIEVHYEGTETQDTYLKKALKEKKDIIYAITNSGGIIVDGEQVSILGNTKLFKRTERLIIRPIAQNDLDDICQYGCDEETGQYMIHWPKSREEINSFITEGIYAMNCEDCKWYEFVLELASTHKVIGNITVRKNNDAFEIGWISNKLYWGKGYMSEAVKAVIDYLLNSTGINKIIAMCTDKNIASYRVMEKCGMTRIAEENDYKSNKNGIEVTYNKLTYCIS